MTKPRILIIDNDPKVGIDLLEILRPEDYDVKVVPHAKIKVAAAVKAMAQQFRPHVAIVDLRLSNDFNTADKSGLKLLSHLRSAYCILYTAYLSFDIMRDVYRHGLVGARSKGEHPDTLLEDIRSGIQRDGFKRKPLAFRGCSPEQIVQALFGQNTSVPSDLVNTVVYRLMLRLFPEARKITLDPLLKEPNSGPIVSRNHSVVLKASVDDLEPIVLKLAPAPQIQKECANYHKVGERLAGHFLASLRESELFWDLGGSAYSFLGSSRLQSLVSFEAYYCKEEKPANVLRPLTHLFGEVWGALYSKTKCCKGRTSLFRRYERAFHIRKHLERLDACERALALPNLSYPLLNPVRWVLDHQDESQIDDARLAITHGDLHAQNLYVDGEHAWTIDFERAGLGHGLRDFIELETDIVTRLVPFPEDDPTLFFRFSVSLAALNEPKSPSSPALVANLGAQKALGIICGIRKLAHEATNYQDSREYLWGLLLNAIYAGCLAEERSSQRRRAVILASVLCERLNRWNQAWPPTEWLPVLGSLDETVTC
jgi:DNA-binding NarL/FixJ family response regulator